MEQLQKDESGYYVLPCGGRAMPEELGMRCWTCLTIYGSIACPCTRQQAEPRRTGHFTRAANEVTP